MSEFEKRKIVTTVTLMADGSHTVSVFPYESVRERVRELADSGARILRDEKAYVTAELYETHELVFEVGEARREQWGQWGRPAPVLGGVTAAKAAGMPTSAVRVSEAETCRMPIYDVQRGDVVRWNGVWWLVVDRDRKFEEEMRNGPDPQRVVALKLAGDSPAVREMLLSSVWRVPAAQVPRRIETARAVFEPGAFASVQVPRRIES